jgi:hypothetical protein
MKNTSNTPKDRSLSLKARICRLLRWTEEQYFHFQYNSGLTYLEHYVPDEHYAQEVSKSRIFWNWWKLQWMNRDEVFLEHISESSISVSTVEELYLEMNNGVKLTESNHPHSTVMEESYAQMVQELNKAEVCKTR